MDQHVTDILVGLNDLNAGIDRAEALAHQRDPRAFVTVTLWSVRANRWRAQVYWSGTSVNMQSVDAADPVVAIDGLCRLINRRFQSDDAIARTLGIGETA